MYRKLRTKKFTLVELLCSIAIMIVLVSLLMVTVQQVRDRANKTVNINNLRQISYAIQMYAMDHDGSLPYISKNITDSRCLFLVLPYTNYALKLFFPIALYETEKSNPENTRYFNNPSIIINDLVNYEEEFYPGYAYTAIDDKGRPLKEQRLDPSQPIVTNINGTYKDTLYLLYSSGSVHKIKGPRANDSIITE